MIASVYKRLSIGFSILLVFIFIAPLAFSSGHRYSSTIIPLKDSTDSVTKEIKTLTTYDHLNLGVKGLSRQAFDCAIKGFEKLKTKGKLGKQNLLTIIDFTQPSNKKRLFVFP